MRALLLLVTALCGAGCYDFHALGGRDAAIEAVGPDLGQVGDLGRDDADPDGGSCACGTGQNCVAGVCVTAPADCATLWAMYPPTARPPDGLYWLLYGAKLHRAYCDMRQQVALCTDVPGEAHNTRTRDGSNLSVRWSSTLADDGGSCSLWAIQADDGHPFGPLNANGKAKISSCQGLGFVGGDSGVKFCRYGKANLMDVNQGTCGFANTDWLIYFNECPTCPDRKGSFSYWTLLGQMSNTVAMSTVNGNVKSACATR